MVIYYYCEKEAPIRQGDIFRNIPFFSFDMILYSSDNKKSLDDQTEKIINEITEKSKPILVETYLDSTLCVLVSQDCDIENNYDLIFYLLEDYKSSEVDNYKLIEKKITQTTREFYLPKIELQESEKIGPLKVNFFEPIKIPSKLIKKRLKDLRIASMKDSIRKIFIDKLNFFLSRIGLEPVIFFEIEQIQQKVIHYWKDSNVLESIKREKIDEIKYTLKQINRHDDIFKIFWDKPVDIEKVLIIKKNLENLNLRTDDGKLIEICEEILSISNQNKEGLDDQQKKFKLLKYEVFENEDCLFSYCNSKEGEKAYENKLKELEINGKDTRRFEAAFDYFKS